MSTFANQLEKAVKEAKVRGDLPELLNYIASIVNESTGFRSLAVNAARTPVLTPSELAHLERLVSRDWMSAKAVWLAVRPNEPYEHGVSVQLGKQLALRYPKQRKYGPTRMYWIESPAIGAPIA